MIEKGAGAKLPEMGNWKSHCSRLVEDCLAFAKAILNRVDCIGPTRSNVFALQVSEHNNGRTRQLPEMRHLDYIHGLGAVGLCRLLGR